MAQRHAVVTVRDEVAVETERCTPVPQAIVTVEARSTFEDAVLHGIPGREHGLFAVTAADGSYRIENAPASAMVRVSAVAAGFARVIQHDVNLSAQNLVETNFELPPLDSNSEIHFDENLMAVAGGGGGEFVTLCWRIVPNP